MCHCSKHGKGGGKRPNRSVVCGAQRGITKLRCSGSSLGTSFCCRGESVSANGDGARMTPCTGEKECSPSGQVFAGARGGSRAVKFGLSGH